MLNWALSKRYYVVLFSAFGVFTLMILSLIDFYYNRHVSAIIYNELAAKAEMKFENQQRRLDEHLGYVKTVIAAVLEDREFETLVKNGDYKQAEAFEDLPFRNILAMSDLWHMIRFIDGNGYERVGYDKDHRQVTVRNLPFQNYRDRPVFQETLKLPKGRFYISELRLKARSGSVVTPYVPTLMVAAPVRYGETFYGIIVVDILADNIFRSEQFRDYFDFFMVDGGGYYLHHDDPNKAWSHLLHTRARYYGDLPRTAGFQAQHDENHYIYRIDGMREPIYLIAVTKTEILKGQNDLVRQYVSKLRGTVLFASLATAFLVAALLSNIYSKLSDRNNRLEEALELLDEHIIYSETDRYGVIVDVSSAFSKRYGYGKHELLGHNHNIVRHPTNPPGFFESMWQSMSEGKEWQGEIRNQDREGKSCYLYTTIKPKYDQRGELIGYISTSIDITEKKQLQEQTEQMVFQSRHAIMGEMLGIIAHQWKQPLNHLSVELYNLYNSTNQVGPRHDHARAQYKKCEDILIHLSEIISTFRTFFKPDGQKQSVSLAECVTSSLLLIESKVEKFGVEIEMSNRSVLDRVYGVENEIIQSLVNILHNAIDEFGRFKHPQPKITVELYNEGKVAVVRICDNAGGVKKKNMPYLFDPYFTTKGEAGTGLGLYLVHTIVVEKLKGSLSAKNRGGGLCVSVKLPLQMEEHSDEGTQNSV